MTFSYQEMIDKIILEVLLKEYKKLNMNNKVYVDERGSIEMILENCEIGSISRIDSVANSTRASHYHLRDNHTVYVSKGEIHMYERPVGSKTKPVLTIVETGQTHFTPEMVEHSMWFKNNSEFFCFSKLPRTQSNYENETVRFEKSLRDVYNEWVD